MYDNQNFDDEFGNDYDTKNSHVAKIKSKTIVPLLLKFGVPETIAIRADKIKNKLKGQIRRGKKYTMLMYFCTHSAYLEYIDEQTELISKGEIDNYKGYVLGFEPIQMGENFGLTKNELQQGFCLFSPLQTGYKPPSSYISIFIHIPNYCKCINLSNESIIDVIALANYILSKDPSLRNESQRSTAAGIVHYYTYINDITISNPDEFSKLVHYSFSTIENISKKIAILDNL